MGVYTVVKMGQGCPELYKYDKVNDNELFDELQNVSGLEYDKYDKPT